MECITNPQTEITSTTFNTLESALHHITYLCPCKDCDLNWSENKNCWECRCKITNSIIPPSQSILDLN